MDPTVFPEPAEFKPERWIEAKQKNTRLDRYMVSFGRGSRQCVGIKYVSTPCGVMSSMWYINTNLHLNSLAYAEMFLTLATVLPRFDMKIYKTTTEDVRVARDHFVGVPEPGSQGVRVTIDRIL